jgi:hypothetical protein
MPARCRFGRSCGRTADKEEEMSDEYGAWLAALKPGDEVASDHRHSGGALSICAITHADTETVHTTGCAVFMRATGRHPLHTFSIRPATERDRLILRHAALRDDMEVAFNGRDTHGEELPDAELAEMVSRMERALAVLMGKED